jgi:DNA polymerase-3 subunit gamma/tau
MVLLQHDHAHSAGSLSLVSSAHAACFKHVRVPRHRRRPRNRGPATPLKQAGPGGRRARGLPGRAAGRRAAGRGGRGAAARAVAAAAHAAAAAAAPAPPAPAGAPRCPGRRAGPRRRLGCACKSQPCGPHGPAPAEKAAEDVLSMQHAMRACQQGLSRPPSRCHGALRVWQGRAAPGAAAQVEGAAAEVSARAAAAAQRTAARQWATSADDAPLAGIPAEEARPSAPPSRHIALYFSFLPCACSP